jgi:hypothetical protein
VFAALAEQEQQSKIAITHSKRIGFFMQILSAGIPPGSAVVHVFSCFSISAITQDAVVWMP